MNWSAASSADFLLARAVVRVDDVEPRLARLFAERVARIERLVIAHGPAVVAAEKELVRLLVHVVRLQFLGGALLVAAAGDCERVHATSRTRAIILAGCKGLDPGC